MRYQPFGLRFLVPCLALLASPAAPVLGQIPFPSDVTSPSARLGYRAVPESAPATVQPTSRPGFNPLLSPYGNPYLNPYLTQSTLTPDAALLYLLAAQRESGGIGSGMLSGVRQAEMGPSNSTRTATLLRSAAAPGLGAGRYFHRGVDRMGQPSADYFNRSVGRMGR